MFINIIHIFLKFIIYSFLGYIVEVIYCSFLQKKLVNRGFLFGPICPIYGVGAIIMIFSLSNYVKDPIFVFLLGVLLTSTLEYFTSYIFEKIFNNKWWDYSNKSFNINGRICLFNSIFFGIGALIVLYVSEPFVNNFLNSLSDTLLIILFFILLVLLILDIIFSSIIAYNLKNKLIIAEELKAEKIKMLPKLFDKKYIDEIMKIRIKTNRLIKVYPNLAKDLRKELGVIRNFLLENSVNKIGKKRKKK